jgi:hypothetical protein
MTWLRALAVLFALVCLPAASCDVKPVSPVPAAGGLTSTGGASAVGGSVQGGDGGQIGGSSGAIGGSSTVETTVVAAVEFPVCNPPTKKAKPFDPSKVRLGRKAAPITKHRKVSYQSLPEAKPVFWRSTVPWALNQADLGACVGFATVQARLSEPFKLDTIPGKPTTFEALNQLARDVYSSATSLDLFPGSWRPDDTGSSGDAGMKAAIAKGLFAGYSTVDSLAGLQSALRYGPLSVGVDWFQGFFSPSRCGSVSKGQTAPVGGHQITAVGDDPDRKVIWLLTSWDNDFGVCLGSHCGYFHMSYGLVSELFAAGADAEQPR